ncbi:MAG TPA: RluA family pseudouridine synthase, partial [Phycisphaerales bacterium]|nr:RluA family pseudouridine synthase [Phycisphaerales bacterium]
MHPLGPPSSLRILHRSPRFVVVEKPSLFLSVPGRGPHKSDCMTARVRAAFPHATGSLTVHRLDYETSGLMVFALDEQAHRDLSAQFEHRKVFKEYTALLHGHTTPDSGVISLPLRADIDQWPRPVHIVDHVHGREAITDYTVQARSTLTRHAAGDPFTGDATTTVTFGEASRWMTDAIPITRIVFTPRTGRSHQLRVHAAAGLRAPIIGDPLYGGPAAARLMLHASQLTL